MKLSESDESDFSIDNVKKSVPVVSTTIKMANPNIFFKPLDTFCNIID